MSVVTPCVHRRQIVDRQYRRYGVFNTFAWICVHRQRHDKTVFQQLKELRRATTLRRLFCLTTRMSAVLSDGAVYTGDNSVDRPTRMNSVYLTV
jgi:hypothetical protein